MDASQFEQLVNVAMAGFGCVLYGLGYLAGLGSV